MKKDKKFLCDLENSLSSIRKKDRDVIVLKYKNIIDEKIKNKERIRDIIKELGIVEEIAKKEISYIKSNKFSIIKYIKGIHFNRKDKPKKMKTKKSKLKKKNKKNIFKKKTSFFEKVKLFFSKIKFKKEKKITPVGVIEEIIEDTKEEISNVSEVVVEKKIFESEKTRRNRIILKSLGILLTGIILFIWLWITVIFIASLVAFLDGVRIVGINIALFGLDILVLWILVIVNRCVFKRKNNNKFNLIIIVVCVLFIAIGIALTIDKVSKIKTVKDVSEKYSMTTKVDTYNLPSDENIKMYLLFNSNYDTQYMINYDKTLENKIKVDVKYYECYYDYYVKKSSNNIYVSLKLDQRDRFSVFVDDIKEGKVFDDDELSRYIVKISVNPKDYSRLVIEN